MTKQKQSRIEKALVELDLVALNRLIRRKKEHKNTPEDAIMADKEIMRTERFAEAAKKLRKANKPGYAGYIIERGLDYFHNSYQFDKKDKLRDWATDNLNWTPRKT